VPGQKPVPEGAVFCLFQSWPKIKTFESLGMGKSSNGNEKIIGIPGISYMIAGYFIDIATYIMSIRFTSKLAVIAFLLHVVWENAQAPLYAGYRSFSQHFSLCLIGTLGDVAITLAVLAFMLLIKKELTRPADFLALAILGLMIAVLIEQHALLVGKWSYAFVMPLLPVVKVGLAPILQMTLLLPLSFYLARTIKFFK
jgi:hypothetical protein